MESGRIFLHGDVTQSGSTADRKDCLTPTGPVLVCISQYLPLPSTSDQ